MRLALAVARDVVGQQLVQPVVVDLHLQLFVEAVGQFAVDAPAQWIRASFFAAVRVCLVDGLDLRPRRGIGWSSKDSSLLTTMTAM